MVLEIQVVVETTQILQIGTSDNKIKIECN